MINFLKNHWWKFLISLILFVVVIVPVIYLLVTGSLPPGYPLQRQIRSQSTNNQLNVADSDKKDSEKTIKKSNIDVFAYQKIKGFTPFYYEPSQPPKIAVLKSWGANLININIEDEAGFKEQNILLKANNLPELPLPNLAPSDPTLERVIEDLVKETKNLDLAVSLAIPVSEKWLKLAQSWQVDMIWLNGEADAWVIKDIKAQEINQINQVFLQKSRQFYTGYIGTGFTNLVDRQTMKATANASQYDLTGFDFLTINPHPDPSMKAERLIDYVTVTTQTAREIADRSKIKKLILGAIIVKTATNELQGFIPEEAQRYPEKAESDFYQKLLETTQDSLDGYFLISLVLKNVR